KPTVRKTVQYKLRPTAEQERALAQTLGLCHRLSKGALEQRRTWWGRGQGQAAPPAQQEAELPERNGACPDYQPAPSPGGQDVRTRRDRPSQEFCRRVQAGEKAGLPRLQGTDRSHSFTSTQVGTGATLDTGCLVRAKLGRLAVRWSRPLVGTPKTRTLARAAD